MPSYTKEQRNEALKVLEEECKWSVTAAINRLGYPSRQTMYQWISQADGLHERVAGRLWSHYDPALKKMAVKMVGGGLEGSAVASMLGVSSGAVVHKWVRKAQRHEAMRMKSPKVDGPIEVTGDEPAWSGFGGSEEERIEQLQLENDILRGVVEVGESSLRVQQGNTR
jgi:transposase-like protein